MLRTKSAYATRSLADRRDPVERRILNMGSVYKGKENREYSEDRRRGWEDRYGWERISKWSSSPIYSDLP